MIPIENRKLIVLQIAEAENNYLDCDVVAYNITKLKAQKELEDLYNEIPEGTGLLDTVRQIVELEILLERECN